MFSWYENAVECYAYLCDVPDKPFEESMWFTRGWTLQELIAPRVERFYDRDWKLIGDKRSLDKQLATITKIPTEVLLNEDRLSRYSIAQRMSWASKRTTTRIEDRAYSLLGIFSNMPMLYGEGKAAFRRLQEELIKRSDDLTILFWEDKDHPKNLLAPSPSAFEFSSSVENLLMSAGGGFKRSHLFSLTNIGLSMKLILIPWAIDICVAVVGCSEHISSLNGDNSLNRRWYCIFLHVNLNPYTDELMYRTCYDGKSTLELYGKWNGMKWDPPWCAVDSFNRIYRMSEKECMVRLVGPDGLRPGVHGIRLHIRGGGKRVWGPTSRLEAEDIQCSAGYEFEANKDYSILLKSHPGVGYVFAKIHTHQKHNSDNDKYSLCFGFNHDGSPVCFVSTMARVASIDIDCTFPNLDGVLRDLGKDVHVLCRGPKTLDWKVCHIACLGLSFEISVGEEDVESEDDVVCYAPWFCIEDTREWLRIYGTRTE